MIELYKCQKCGKSVFEKFGSGKFCSRACANSRKFSSETNEKRRISNKRAFERNPELRKKCSDNAKKLNASRDYSSMKGRHLSEETKSKISAALVGRRHSEETKQKCCEAQLERVRNGTHKGWQNRNITSYAEKFWTRVLDNNGVSYKRELTVKYSNGPNDHYFLDFYIESNGRKIDLEIDGKQHKYVDRAEHDRARDERLSNLGYVVYRIDWNEINSEEGKLRMKEKIDKFLDFLNK